MELSKKSEGYKVYNGGHRTKKIKSTFGLTKEKLLGKALELRSGKQIAQYFGCTPANISWWVKKLGIQNEYHKSLGKLNYEVIGKLT